MPGKEAFSKAAMFGVYTRRVFHSLFQPRLLLFTNTAIGGGIMFLADAAQQRVDHQWRFEEPENFRQNWDRSTAMFKVGLCFGVVGHYWYKFLDWKFVGHTGIALGKKLLSEVAAGPLFGLGMFLGVGYAEGKERRQSIIDFLGNVENLIIADIFFYIPCQYYNFNVLPPRFRFLFVGFITFFYDAFLSYIIHKSEYQDRKPYLRLFALLKSRYQEDAEKAVSYELTRHKQGKDGARVDNLELLPKTIKPGSTPSESN